MTLAEVPSPSDKWRCEVISGISPLIRWLQRGYRESRFSVDGCLLWLAETVSSATVWLGPFKIGGIPRSDSRLN